MAAEAEELMEDFNALFSLRRPRDVIAGTSSALKTLGKGVGIGLGALVALPYAKAKETGVKGAVVGLAQGVGVCAATTVTATLVAGAQVTRGVLNTPRCVIEKRKGDRRWDPKKRIWETESFNLPEVYASLPNEEKTQTTSADTVLYDRLGVASTASNSEIKKGFYRESLKWHPDKNPGPEAKKKFQEISEAYAVLGDAKRRA